MERLVRMVIFGTGLAAVAWFGVGLAYRLLLGAYPLPLDTGTVPAVARSSAAVQSTEVRDYGFIGRRNIFQPPGAATPAKPAVAPPRDLGLRLLGTVKGSDPASSRAIILDEKKKQQGLYGIGDRIGGAVLEKILAGKVLVRVGGRLVELTVEATTGKTTAAVPSAEPSPVPAGAEVISVSRHRVNNAIRAAGRILKSIEVTPYEVDGEQKGFRVNRLKVGSFLHQMGLRNRDVVMAVNGEPLTSMEAAVRLFEKYRDSDEATVTILRRGEKKEIHYRIRR